MAETYNKNQGFLLISSLFVLTTMLIIVSFYLSETAKEAATAKIVDTAPQTYYLAEAGIQEAFWKLQNDSSYKNNFESDPAWSATFSRSDSLVDGGSYTVTIENTDAAQATITATSTISVAGTQTQRVVKAGVFKALNDSPISDTTFFSNGELYSAASNIEIDGGDIFSNDDVDLNFFSSWSTTNDAKAVEDIQVDISSSLSAENKYDSSNPPIPSEITTPQIDFDSQDSESLKSQADFVYTKQEFRDLMNSNPALEIDGVVYVTGDVTIKKGNSVAINGALVADGSIGVGNGFSLDPSAAQLHITKAAGKPSGIISKKNITLGGFSIDVDVEGLIYAGRSVRIQDGIFETVNINVNGGIIAQNITVLMSWNTITITHNQTYISEALGVPMYSQVLFIDHWEEEY